MKRKFWLAILILSLHVANAQQTVRVKEYQKEFTTYPFYQAHPQQYIMGMLYAKTLLLNNHYEAADKLLTSLQIIPFEGSTQGHELYRQAKLMQTLIQV
jgi:hypothetical protein